MDQSFLLWFAGFFEGEGCFHIRKKDNYPFLQISQSEKNNGEFICKKIQQKLGGHVYKYMSEGKRTSFWMWSLSSRKEILKLIKLILPYCQFKNKQYKKKFLFIQQWIKQNLTKICPICKQQFLSTNITTIYCSKKCRRKYRRQYNKSYLQTKNGKEKNCEASYRYYLKYKLDKS